MGKGIKVGDKVLTDYGVGTFIGIDSSITIVRLHGKKNKVIGNTGVRTFKYSEGWSNGMLKDIKTKTKQGLVYCSLMRKIK